MKKVLIVESNQAVVEQIRHLLGHKSIPFDCSASLAEAKQLIQQTPYKLIIAELALADGAGTDLLQTSKHCPLLVMSNSDDIQTAVDVMRMGAVDYIAKPFDGNDKLTQALDRIFPPPPPNQAQQTPTTGLVQSLPGMIGNSSLMLEVYRRIRKAAPTRSTVLIRGETGTGKELVARAIHDASDRADKPFIAVNCAAIPETLIESELFGHEKGAFTGAAGKRSGLIEAAEGGTLFLDEIGELPSEAQARLLRFIQESEIRRVGSNESHHVDVRLVVATHRDLQMLAKTAAFRPDLYYRINVFRIFLPALRQRGSDLLEIAEYLLEKASLKHDKPGLYLLPDAVQAISHYDWPGNVRELENVIERAAIMADELSINRQMLEIDVDAGGSEPQPFEINDEAIATGTTPLNAAKDPQEDLSLEDYFQRFVLENQEHMNETELAKKLGISRKCLWERRNRLGIPRQKNSHKTGNRNLND